MKMVIDYIDLGICDDGHRSRYTDPGTKGGWSMRWGMVVNLVKCTRCHACVAACRIEHFLPLGMTWPRLIAWETEEQGQELSTVPVRCNQCKEAPCVDVCPAEATKKREDGIVYVDNKKCVGCRYCVIACPYQNRTFFSKDKDPGFFPGS